MIAPSSDVLAVVNAYQAAVAKLSARAALTGLRWFASSVRRGGGGKVAAVAAPHVDDGLRLGVTFYRLYRALVVGRTTPDILRPGVRESAVSVGALVRDFERACGVRVPVRVSQSLRVAVEPVDVGPLILSSVKVGELDYAQKLLDDRAESTAKNGRGFGESDEVYASGVVQQAAANGARRSVSRMGAKDRRLVGWLRVSGTGSPCHFCAMLMSRGAAYASKGTAWGGGGPQDHFHPHCKCTAIPKFSGEPLPPGVAKLNQFYWEEWKALSRSLGRAPSLSDWRKDFYRKYGR